MYAGFRRRVLHHRARGGVPIDAMDTPGGVKPAGSFILTRDDAAHLEGLGSGFASAEWLRRQEDECLMEILAAYLTERYGGV